MKKLSIAVQILGIIGLAAFAGAMLMLSTALVSFWKQLPPDEFFSWYANYASGIELTTGPLVKVSMLFPLVSIVLVWKVPASRIYWLISYAFVIGIMVFTMSYFVGTNTAFATQAIETDLVRESVNTWGDLHTIRILMGFAAAIFAALGLTKYISSTAVAVNPA